MDILNSTLPLLELSLYGIIGITLISCILNYVNRQSFDKKWSKQLTSMDTSNSQDVDEIIKHIVGKVYPFEFFLALNFCFYRTFCSPSIASVYRKTGTIYNTTEKRANDTDLLMHIWMDYGLDSEMGKASYTHLNKIHGLHSGVTRNVDFVFVLCALVEDACQFTNNYGARPIEEKEKLAIWEFYKRVGQRMNLKDIPDTIEECHEFLENYTNDNRQARVTKDGQVLTEAITQLVVKWYYLLPEFLVRIVVSVVIYQMGATFHNKLGLKKPSALSFAFVNSVLYFRKTIMKYCLPVNNTPFKLSDYIMSNDYGCPVASSSINKVGPLDMLAKMGI